MEDVIATNEAAKSAEDLQIDTPQPENQLDESQAGIDYEALVKEDLAALAAEFPELSQIHDITELDNPLRYAALRDLGLTPKEAYLATSKRQVRQDNRSHLYGTPTRAHVSAGSMSDAELEAAREIFSDMSDAQIRKLYKKVTK